MCLLFDLVVHFGHILQRIGFYNRFNFYSLNFTKLVCFWRRKLSRYPLSLGERNLNGLQGNRNETGRCETRRPYDNNILKLDRQYNQWFMYSYLLMFLGFMSLLYIKCDCWVLCQYIQVRHLDLDTSCEIAHHQPPTCARNTQTRTTDDMLDRMIINSLQKSFMKLSWQDMVIDGEWSLYRSNPPIPQETKPRHTTHLSRMKASGKEQHNTERLGYGHVWLT